MNILLPTSAEDTSIPYLISLIKVRLVLLRQHHNAVVHIAAVEKQEAVNNLLPTSAEDTPISYFISLIKVYLVLNNLGGIVFQAELGKVKSGLQNNWLTDTGINLE